MACVCVAIGESRQVGYAYDGSNRKRLDKANENMRPTMAQIHDTQQQSMSNKHEKRCKSGDMMACANRIRPFLWSWIGPSKFLSLLFSFIHLYSM